MFLEQSGIKFVDQTTKTLKMKMKRLLGAAIFSFAMLFTYAQDLPKASPLGKTEQLVGLTNIKIEYSRPSVKGRKIFGELLPFNDVWRLGANKATIITTDQDLKFGDQLLPAGSYAMFATPMEGKWEVAFNSNTEQWGTDEYDKSLNVVTLIVETKECKLVETLTIGLGNISTESGSIEIAWENTSVSMDFKVNTKEVAEKNIHAAVAKGENLDKVYYNASRYYFDNGQTKEALKFIDQSLEVKNSFRSLYHKAKILASTGKKDKAIELAEEAVKMAKEENEEGWIGYMNNTIEEWKKN